MKKEEKIQTFFDELFNSNTKNNIENNTIEEQNKYFDTLIKEFYSVENMRLKADLTKEQVFLLARATVYADIYNSKVMRKVIQYLLEYSVSKDRKGRIEFNETFKFANDLKADNMGYDNALAGLLGMRRGV